MHDLEVKFHRMTTNRKCFTNALSHCYSGPEAWITKSIMWDSYDESVRELCAFADEIIRNGTGSIVMGYTMSYIPKAIAELIANFSLDHRNAGAHTSLMMDSEGTEHLMCLTTAHLVCINKYGFCGNT